MPKDETTAVSQESLIGRVGTVVLGEARVGNAAQVRVKDAYGQQHYVMVEPDSNDVLKKAMLVLLVSLDGNTFKAILNRAEAWWIEPSETADSSIREK